MAESLRQSTAPMDGCTIPAGLAHGRPERTPTSSRQPTRRALVRAVRASSAWWRRRHVAEDIQRRRGRGFLAEERHPGNATRSRSLGPHRVPSDRRAGNQHRRPQHYTGQRSIRRSVLFRLDWNVVGWRSHVRHHGDRFERGFVEQQRDVRGRQCALSSGMARTRRRSNAAELLAAVMREMDDSLVPSDSLLDDLIGAAHFERPATDDHTTPSPRPTKLATCEFQ